MKNASKYEFKTYKLPRYLRDVERTRSKVEFGSHRKCFDQELLG